MNSEESELIKIGVAAKELGVNRATLRDWVEKGLIGCIVLPTGHRRFKRSDIEKIKNPEKHDDNNPVKDKKNDVK